MRRVVVYNYRCCLYLTMYKGGRAGEALATCQLAPLSLVGYIVM